MVTITFKNYGHKPTKKYGPYDRIEVSQGIDCLSDPIRGFTEGHEPVLIAVPFHAPLAVGWRVLGLSKNAFFKGFIIEGE